MKPSIVGLALGLAFSAQDARAAASESPVVLPEVKVHGPRFESYTFTPSQDQDGSFILVLKPGPRLPDMFTILVGGAQARDVVLTIKSRYGSLDVKSLNRHGWSRAIDYGDLKLVIRRPVGRRAHRILELDARRIPAQ